MNRTLVSLLCVALCLTASRVAFARNADVTKDDPPPGIVPTTASLSSILKAHDAAAGRLVKGPAAVRVEMWAFTSAGSQGTERLVRRGTDYHSVIVTGPFTEEYGQSGDARWYMNQNGAPSDSSGSEYTSFLMYRVLDAASDPKNDVKLLGEVSAPQPAYVIEVKRPDTKHPEWVFFDKQTALVIRTEQVVDKRRLVSIYDDYQTVQGLTEPTHIHDSEGTPALDDDFRRQSIAFQSSIAEAEFKKPPNEIGFMRTERPVYLDARVVRGTVIVRMTVGGRGLDFELSSGDGHSYIDAGVAAELHLPTFGHVTSAEGLPEPYETQIADAAIGDLHLKDFALEALPFHYHADADTRVVGVLGYDFLSSALFSVDYVNEHVSATPLGITPTVGADTYVLPVRFDDGLPFITCVISSHETENVLLDSSFLYSFVFGSFTESYPEAVVDASKGEEHHHTVVPFADSGTYGRDLDVWVANVPDIRIGPTRFLNYKILATNIAWDPGGHKVDAVMGTQFLAYYDVSYDFARGRVLLKHNEFFNKTFRIGQ